MQKLDNKEGGIVSRWFMNVLQWREKHIKEKTFVLMLALVVGVAGGFAACKMVFLRKMDVVENRKNACAGYSVVFF